RLSASLHAVYQTYKRSTTVLIDWLASQGTLKSSDAPESIRLPVRRILELAQEIGSAHIEPPTDIQRAFKLVLVNRRKLTAYYEGNQDRNSEATAESTERHKFFNEVLAKAYDVLFPRPEAGCEKVKETPPSSATPRIGSSNRFEILSDIIEQEPDFDDAFVPELRYDKDEVLSSAQPSAIEDDPMESVFAIHTYLLQVESVIAFLKELWRKVAEESLPVPFAGWLTDLGFEMIKYTAAGYDTLFDNFLGLWGTFLKARESNIRRTGTRLFEPTTSDFWKGQTTDEYQELTYGGALTWPTMAFLTFFVKLRDD
ncbi:hypothetical protein BU26DRAFT_407039, partial [Trematosphaeria pertusa]